MAGMTHQFASRQPEPVAVIIPAYNEAERIGAVLGAASRARFVTQIIVVDDGSRDSTAMVASEWQERDSRICVIRLERNRGKVGAIHAGAEQLRADIVVLLDADLSGIGPAHVERLVAPVRSRQCMMTLGLFQNGRFSTDITHRLFPFLSGQRCLRWSLFKTIVSLPSAGWSLETALNLHAWYHEYSTKNVPWPGVTHAMRPEKEPGVRGYLSHLTMWLHISRYTLRFLRNTGLTAVVERSQSYQPPAGVLGSRRNERPALVRRPLL